MAVYKVKVVGHGVIYRGVDRARAQARADECVPEAQARVITIPERR